jgi:hypothetical protein
MKLKDASPYNVTMEFFNSSINPKIKALTKQIHLNNIELRILTNNSYDIFFKTKINHMRSINLLKNKLWESSIYGNNK